MTNASVSDREDIGVLLLGSSYYLKLADSILAKLDRETLADLLASYLYFKSKGRKDCEFARFVLTERLPQVLPILLNTVPVIVPAIFSDKEFRKLMVNIAFNSVAKK